jgi:hypothetical protein
VEFGSIQEEIVYVSSYRRQVALRDHRTFWSLNQATDFHETLLGGCGPTGSLQEAQRCTTQVAFQVWPPKSGNYLLTVLLILGILVPETC